MPVVEVQSLSFAYDGGSRLFDDVSFRLEAGRKAALVGSNGAGKSTLLALLAGQLQPDSGAVVVAGDVAVISQVAPLIEDDVTVEEWLEERCAEGLLEFDQVHKVLRSLHLSPELAAARLSEGQRFKLHLSVAVMRPGVDLLLLDEPTSHLDLDTVLYLEALVRASPAACIIVSHDSMFLQSTVDTVLELDAATHSLRRTTASFEDYLAARAARKAAAEADAAAKQRKVAALETQAKRLHMAGVRGTHHDTGDKDKLLRDYQRDRAGRSLRAAGVRERQKKRVLADVGDTDVPGEATGFDLATHYHAAGGAEEIQLGTDTSISLVEAVIGHTNGPALGPISLSLSVGEHVVILGDNGCGKTTLLHSLTGMLAVRSGCLETGRNVRLGVLSQDESCGLPLDQSPLALIQRYAPVANDAQYLRLCNIGIKKDAAGRPVRDLSPGLRVRLALLILVLRKVNMLVLDEVTNYIDRSAKEALIEFLTSFAGAVVCVTHDRELLDAIKWRRILVMAPDARSVDELDQASLLARIERSQQRADESMRILFE